MGAKDDELFTVWACRETDGRDSIWIGGRDTLMVHCTATGGTGDAHAHRCGSDRHLPQFGARRGVLAGFQVAGSGQHLLWPPSSLDGGHTYLVDRGQDLWQE